MAELLGMAASIGGLIQLADLVVSRTWPYLKEVKNQRSEISKLSSEVACLAGTLHSIRLLAEGSAILIKHEDILECQKTLEGVRDRLKIPETQVSGKVDRMKRAAQQLGFPYQKAEMQKVLERLDRFKSTFSLALTAESITRQVDIAKDIEDVKAELYRRTKLEAQIQLDQRRKEVLRYFSRANPEQNHAMSLKLRHKGTGLWLLQEPKYVDWINNPDSHIWCYGIPGAGKTVLASLLIEDVLRVCKPSEAVAYFYCDYKDSSKQDPCHIFASISAQLAIQNEKAYEMLEQEYELLDKQGKTKISDMTCLKEERLVSMLKKQIQVFDLTTLVVDGLDECGDNTESVLDFLVLLYGEFKLTFRLAILSRDEMIIRRRLTDIDCKMISVAATSTDIRLYAASEIETRTRSGRLLIESPETKDIILQQLIDKAQGMFRWVACQLDYICDLASDEECCDALDTPAPTLFEIYERLILRLQRRPKSTQALVRSALMWILYSKEPLTFTQLCEAVTVRVNSDQKQRPASLPQIRRFCSSLIRENTNGTCLEVAHFTVTEFFRYIAPETHPQIAYFCFSRGEAYLEFSKTCFTYLNFKNFHRVIPPVEDIEVSLLNDPFYKHAARGWHNYSETNWENEDVVSLAKQFFKHPMSTNFKLWRGFMLSRSGMDSMMEMISVHGDSTLHWAMLLGICELCEWLHECGQDINMTGAFGTPLYATLVCIDDLWNAGSCLHRLVPDFGMFFYLISASWNSVRKQSCIKTLLELGATTDCVFERQIAGELYQLSLHEVMLYSEDPGIFQIEYFWVEFFDKDVAARINAILDEVESIQDTELEMRQGLIRLLRQMKREYVVREFQTEFESFVNTLEEDVELNSEEMINFWNAAMNDQADVLESLLTKDGVKINARDGIDEGDYNDEGDDVAEEDDIAQDYQWGYKGKNALHYSASAGSLACIQVLLDAGASTSVLGKKGTSALHFAAGSPYFGAKQCLEKLLDAGISLHVTNDDGRTALHFAAHSGNTKTVEYLLQSGFDPHHADGFGCTAYDYATENGNEDILKFLDRHRDRVEAACICPMMVD